MPVLSRAKRTQTIDIVCVYLFSGRLASHLEMGLAAGHDEKPIDFIGLACARARDWGTLEFPANPRDTSQRDRMTCHCVLAAAWAAAVSKRLLNGRGPQRAGRPGAPPTTCQRAVGKPRRQWRECFDPLRLWSARWWRWRARLHRLCCEAIGSSL